MVMMLMVNINQIKAKKEEEEFKTVASEVEGPKVQMQMKGGAWQKQQSEGSLITMA